MATVAPGAPTISGETIVRNININDPVVVQRVIQTLVNLRLIGKKLLKGRVDMTGTGSAIFTSNESLYMNQASERIADNADYPLADDANGTPTLVSADKWALATEISDVLISRRRYSEVARKLVRLANQITKDFDSVALSAIATAVTQTQAVTAGVWTGASSDPFADVMLAAALIDEQNRGWNADTVVCRPMAWAYLVSRAKVLDHLPREQASAVLSGNLVQFAGMTFLKTTNMPAGTDVMVMDSNALGSVAYEDQGGNYTGSAEDVQSKTFRREGNDGVRIQARLVNVPMIQEAGSAVELTGVLS